MMPTILLKASHPTSYVNDTKFQLIDEKEKYICLNSYRDQSKAVAKKTNKSHVIKLEFIYPDEYTETIVMKAD
ncbi:hypothetical protein ERX29_07845 [Macrococcus lamae]|uniref:Uncharacterized protein n=2 Tax=Macrococcus lamae TaxID=198484 RepID=A0A4V3BEW3_9STAP|nr:hypothetical protein ERX29_07845 [Macrococcus lamae]